MRKVGDYIYVGCDADIEEFLEMHPDGAVIHAAKEPFHRRFVGYTGRGCPKQNKEYYSALRGTQLALNLIDPDNPAFVADECFVKAAKYLDEWWLAGTPVLVHCNQGRSRSPAIIFYHMMIHGQFDGWQFDTAYNWFSEEVYPDFLPSAGILGFLQQIYRGHVNYE